MRRLYSTFAGGWPGIALLLMRVVVGSVVLWHAGAKLGIDLPTRILDFHVVMIGAALLLIAGLWTPLAGALIAVVAISEIFSTGDHPIGRLLVATNAGALTMLGPGRLSMDARLFGWKRIDPLVRRK